MRSSLPQFRNTGGWRIAMSTFANGLNRRILHVDRRVKIRLADAERYDVSSFSYQPVDFGKDNERILGAETLGTLTNNGHRFSGGIEVFV
jgi:hypothetical protein